MFKKISLLSLFVGLFATLVSAAPDADAPRFAEIDPLDNMPILEKHGSHVAGAVPIEQQGVEFRKFLAASVKIAVSGGSGSGTIVHYDPVKNLAYVASCGHLWTPGVMNVEEGKRKNLTCKIITWYHNDKKLEATRTYNANVVFYSYVNGQDTSLVTFTPDWVPEYYPLGPANYEYKPQQHAHSCGCDGGREVSHYDIEMMGIVGADLVTFRNSPRPGRSGGGLMNDDGYYIGTCWGTQFKDGSGKGFFTPLSVIHRFWSQQAGYGFLLTQKPGAGAARQIPVKDRSGDQGVFAPEYILMPGGR